ncbi:MAG: DUF2156 domain-containing protein [Desulfobacteraceae bacterium]|nr:MAG: DUF2156 domain-containing protein [Desulfobacteraceae bacterium]
MILKHLKYSDYSRLKQFFKRQRYPLCVYSLPSILAWSNEYYKPYGAVKNDTLIVAAEFSEKKENRHLILPVSPIREYSPEELYELAEKLGFSSYWFVPGEYIERHEKSPIKSLFKITAQKEYEDYVYQTADLAELKGNKFSQKRNLIHQFERDYLAKDRVEFGEINKSVASECVEFLEKWCEERDCDSSENDDLACEKEAAINSIEHIDEIDANGIYLRVDGEISAFGIASYLTDDMGVLHFEKAFAGVKGLYQYFDNQCAKRLFEGYRYVNKESDMDIPGLAKVKMSYHPVMRIKSYRLDLL